MLAAGGDRRFFFIGGKGGVGKTTTAASVAVGLARAGRKTLVVSTDPAHSLGDALAIDLIGRPRPVPLDALELPGDSASAGASGGSLHGMEINPSEVIDQLRLSLKLDRLAAALTEGRASLGTGFLSALAKAGVDLDALASLLELTPPGIDEAVALAHMMHLLHSDEHGDFERVVIDTAPTGHTLRLLAFPRFLHGLIGALLSVQRQISSFNPLGAVLGKVVGDDMQQQLEVTKKNLERFMEYMNALNSVLVDAETTSFIVVAIPTHLAVSESKRLLEALQEAKMPARHLVMNQCPFPVAAGGDEDMLQDVLIATEKLEALGDSERDSAAVLRRTVARLQRQHRDAQTQIERLEREAGPSVRILRVPRFEEELTGVASLERYARILFAP